MESLLFRFSHRMFGIVVYWNYRMIERYNKKLLEHKDVISHSIYDKIEMAIIHPLIWTFGALVFLYVNITGNHIKNRVMLVLSAFLVLYIIARFFIRKLKKICFVEKEIELYQTLSDSKKKRLAQKGLFLIVIPNIALPIIVVAILYILQETLWR
ncbi:MAG: hypothetical protein J6034_08020 [Bacteroidaceae bacterium]|nr:hypothetical protein [Bacteroidaceae bacterium]